MPTGGRGRSGAKAGTNFDEETGNLALMVFSSHLFVHYFLPTALIVYFALPRRGKNLGLTALSYAFYGWSNPRYVFLMMASTAVDYACGAYIARRAPRGSDGRREALPEGTPRSRHQRAALTVSIVCNLALLGFFKYFHFALDSYNGFFHLLGLDALQWHTTLRIALPLGISFYTFQSMSYTIDVYRGRARPVGNFVDFACYVSMFPQLVAGPIVRFHQVADALHRRTHSIDMAARGALFFCLGMAKKVLLANPCGTIADAVFDAGAAETLDAWVGMIAYAFQIYFDFSGYSDMAVGLGLVFGFTYPINFDSPYKSKSFTTFWPRWHISLSSWLRDYLYIPLGGNRRGKARTLANLWTVMLLFALWHGASWRFVVWGVIHAGLLMGERALGGRSFFHRLPEPLQVAATFLVLQVTWPFFRSPDLESAFRLLGNLFGLGYVPEATGLAGGILYGPHSIGVLAISAAVIWGCPNTWHWCKEFTWPKAIVAAVLLWLSLIMLMTQTHNPFIYFVF